MNDFFKTHQITRQQYNVLRILRGSYPKPLNINIIKERMLDKMSDASRIVERLRIKGLIDRCQSSQDRRAVEIKISEKGLSLLSHTDSNVTQFDDLLSSLNDDELDQINHLLDKIRSWSLVIISHLLTLPKDPLIIEEQAVAVFEILFQNHGRSHIFAQVLFK